MFNRTMEGENTIEDIDGLSEEIKCLEEKVKNMQNDLFQLQRNALRRKSSTPKKKSEKFIRPQKIILQNSTESLKNDLELMSMLSGMEVKSYKANDHCCVVYHMQHEALHEVKHGLCINMSSGVNEVEKMCLPLGFNFNAIKEDFDNVMTPVFLGAVRKALVAYYDRQEQFHALQKLVNIEAELFKIMDGSHMEIKFAAKRDIDEEEEVIEVVLMLDYRVYDIRPKNYSFRETDLPEGSAVTLRTQCAVFKKLPLDKAFKQAFIDGLGPYKIVQQLVPRSEIKPRRKHKRSRPNQHNYNNDDTFRPEDCTESSDEPDEV